MISHRTPAVIPPLPRHPPPQPDEDLASLLMRTAKSMGYDYPQWILHPEAPRPRIAYSAHVLWLRKQADYHLLEQLLHLTQSQLYHLTLHRFAAYLQPPRAGSANNSEEIPLPLLPPKARSRFFLIRQTTQVCPECLAEGHLYGQVSWHCQFVTLCLKHRRFLIRHCPVCSAVIPALRQALTMCPVCQRGDYRRAPVSPKIEDHNLLSGHLWLLQHLGIDPVPSFPEGLDLLPEPLQPLSPWQYWELLESFQYLLNPLLPAHPVLQGSPTWQDWLPRPWYSPLVLSQYASATLVATFHTLFASWPTRFVAVLEALQRQPIAPTTTTGIYQDFKAFYIHLVARQEDPALAFVSEAFADYLWKHYTRGRVHQHLQLFRRVGVARLQERPYLTTGEASRLLEVPLKTVQALAQQSLLREVPQASRLDSRQARVWIEKASVEALQQAWHPLLPLGQVATSLLGIRPETMAGLAKKGLLSPMRGPRVDGYPVVLYSPEHVKKLINDLLQHALSTPGQAPDGIPLAQLYRFSNSWRSLAEVVLGVLRGRLIPIDTKTKEPVLKRLIVLRQS